MAAISFLVVLAWTAGLVFSIFIVKLLLVLTGNTKYAKMADAIPGPKKSFFGIAWDLWCPKEDMFLTFVDIANKYADKSVTRYWFGPFEARYMVRTGKSAEIILNNTTHITKGDDYRFVHSWLGLGLLTSTGKQWAIRRKLLTPSFHFKILDDFIPIFNEQSQILVSLLKKNAGKGAFDIFPYITHCTLDIICESAMGTNFNAQNDSDSEYVKAVTGLGAIVLQRVAKPWLGNDFLFNFFPQKKEETKYLNILHSTSRKVIKKRKEFFERNISKTKINNDEIFGKKKRLAFLDTMLDIEYNGKKLSDEEIREEVDTFMFEGHDTTSSSITWTLFLLGHHPDIQIRVQEELESILGDSTRAIETADISQMKYMEAVIKEAVRLYPAVPMFARKLQEDVLVDGYIIPAKSNVFIGSYFIHRDPDEFPDPEQFKPERFLEHDTKRHPYGYVPFSAGPRNCIGQKYAMMELKVVLADILRNFRVISHDKREDLKIVVEPILRPAFELNMSVEKRTTKI